MSATKFFPALYVKGKLSFPIRDKTIRRDTYHSSQCYLEAEAKAHSSIIFHILRTHIWTGSVASLALWGRSSSVSELDLLGQLSQTLFLAIQGASPLRATNFSKMLFTKIKLDFSRFPPELSILWNLDICFYSQLHCNWLPFVLVFSFAVLCPISLFTYSLLWPLRLDLTDNHSVYQYQ